MARPQYVQLLAHKKAADLRVRDVMTANPTTLDAGIKLSEAWKIMESKKIMHMPVMKDGKLAGLLSERHIHDAMPSILLVKDPVSRQKALELTRIDQVWIASPTTVTSSDSLLQAIHAMRSVKAGSLPVVDNGQLVGIVTAGDLISLLEAVLEHDEGRPKVPTGGHLVGR